MKVNNKIKELLDGGTTKFNNSIWKEKINLTEEFYLIYIFLHTKK
jgi:hypothetical protein